ncbi:MAG: hypothetical protein AVDCRST_MAG59-3204, partial [uncultured Thermomicrobiales bacterium]
WRGAPDHEWRADKAPRPVAAPSPTPPAGARAPPSPRVPTI